MFFITILFITAACLVIPVTRLYGVLGAVGLLYFFPYETLSLIGVLLVAVGAYFYFQRRKSNEY